jgi:hypothetical protein
MESCLCKQRLINGSKPKCTLPPCGEVDGDPKVLGHGHRRRDACF